MCSYDDLQPLLYSSFLQIRKKFNIDVLHQFVHHHKFHGLDLVGALRYKCHIMFSACLSTGAIQGLPGKFPAPWRSTENRSYDGILCTKIL